MCVNQCRDLKMTHLPCTLIGEKGGQQEENNDQDRDQDFHLGQDLPEGQDQEGQGRDLHQGQLHFVHQVEGQVTVTTNGSGHGPPPKGGGRANAHQPVTQRLPNGVGQLRKENRR